MGSRDDTTDGVSGEGDEAGAHDSTLLILERARLGDRTAAMLLLERAVPVVRQWSRGRVPPIARGEANTEDVVQDAVLRVLPRLSRFRHETVGGLQAYLRTVVMNRVRDLIRKSKRHGTPVPVDADPLPDDDPSPLELAMRRQNIDRFLAALQRLAPSDRQLIVWRIELGWSVDEIAARQGKKPSAARMAIRRAIERLDAALESSKPVRSSATKS
jgi:RNA polymerase sigma-70 factor (ECF subfamily)